MASSTNKASKLRDNISGRIDVFDDTDKPENNEDEYYIREGIEPPRFALYRKWRIDNCTDEWRKQTLECVNDSITHDELDYSLKAQLREPPEERYQRYRSHYYFHDLSYIKQTVTTDAEGNNHYKDIIKDYGCGHPSNPKREGQRCWCVPECRFYPEYGRIEDSEIIADHEKYVESYRKKNAIIDIDLSGYKS